MPIRASPVVRRLGVAIGLTSAILPIIAVASLLLAVGRSPVPTDFSYFGPSGAHLLLGRFGDVYRDPGNQGGPLEIIPAGIATLAGATDPVGLTVFYLVNIWALLVGASMLLLSVVGPARRTVAYVVMGAGALAVLVGFIPAAIHVGHPSQAAIPLLWIGAAVCAQRDRPVATGVLLAVSVGFETWGILGAVILLMLPRRRWLLAGAIVVAGAAVFYLPFVLSGHFAMLSYSWPVIDTTLVGRLFPDLHRFPWGLRLAQAAITAGAAAVVARLARRDPDVIWIVPLTIVVVRLGLDPVQFAYYWIEVGVIMGAVLPIAAMRRAWGAVALSAAGTLLIVYVLTKGLFS